MLALPHSACPSWSLMGSSVPIPSAHTLMHAPHVHVLCRRSESSGRKNKFVLGNTTLVLRAPVLKLACDWTQKLSGPVPFGNTLSQYGGHKLGSEEHPAGSALPRVSLILSEECCRRWRAQHRQGPGGVTGPGIFPREQTYTGSFDSPPTVLQEGLP